MPVKFFGLFLNWVGWLLSAMCGLYWKIVLYQIRLLPSFSPVSELYSNSLDKGFCRVQKFNFIETQFTTFFCCTLYPQSCIQ